MLKIKLVTRVPDLTEKRVRTNFMTHVPDLIDAHLVTQVPENLPTIVGRISNVKRSKKT